MLRFSLSSLSLFAIILISVRSWCPEVAEAVIEAAADAASGPVAGAWKCLLTVGFLNGLAMFDRFDDEATRRIPVPFLVVLSAVFKGYLDWRCFDGYVCVVVVVYDCVFCAERVDGILDVTRGNEAQ
eukprot:6010888-Amphidinium_carterae.1